MKCIYVSISKWLMIVLWVYMMFVALLSNAIVAALISMFIIFYVDLIGDKVCDHIRKKNAKRIVSGQYKKAS